MKTMIDVCKRQNELKQIFRIGNEIALPSSDVDIDFCSFQSNYLNANRNKFDEMDSHIIENIKFQYPVFHLRSQFKEKKAILLLHGLNERSWEKYLTWAEYLCLSTQRPVILFPIAFHINRSQSTWLNFKSIFNYLFTSNKFKDKTISVANYTISERLSENPIRFFTAGMQTIDDISVLINEIRSDMHIYFDKNCTIDFFAYSIGAFITQIAFMANPHELFSNSKAFLFCGGSLFKYMNGLSKNIMDKTCYDTLMKFYVNNSWLEKANTSDIFYRSFVTMIDKDINKNDRYQFFNSLDDRMKIISLKKDNVMSFEGIEAAVGTKFAAKNITKMDYSYVYQHENPFPMNNFLQKENITNYFNRTFRIIGDFFNS